MQDTEQKPEPQQDEKQVMPPPMMPAPKAAEKDQEAQLRKKYPGLKGPGSSAFLQKRLSKGQKYFDSGDYNMAKAKMGTSTKPVPAGQKLLLPGSTGDAIPTPDTVPQRKTSIIQQSKLAGHGHHQGMA